MQRLTDNVGIRLQGVFRMSQSPTGIRNAAIAVILSLVVGCASESSRPGHAPVAVHAPSGTGSSRSVSQRAALAAVKQVGAPYRYGGSNERGFDCSGLVHYAYSKAGRSLPRTTSELWRQLAPVPASDLRVGDVLFFDIDGRVAHVGLYLGGRRFVHAPKSGSDVSVASLESDYYRAAFIRGGRPR